MSPDDRAGANMYNAAENDVFPGTLYPASLSSAYWSTTPSDLSTVWDVMFGIDGKVSVYEKVNLDFVRCVSFGK